jgi:hypothetical protein
MAGYQSFSRLAWSGESTEFEARLISRLGVMFFVTRRGAICARFVCFIRGLLTDAGGDAPTRARRALEAWLTPDEQEGAALVPVRVHIITRRAVDGE